MAPTLLVAPAVLTPPRRRRGSEGPPRRPPGDGDGGGGDGNDHGSAPDATPGGPGLLALALVVIGVTTLFLVLVAVALLLRRPAPDWHAATIELPLARLAASSLALFASSLALEHAARRPRTARRALALGLGAGLVFLGLQSGLWLALFARGAVPAAGGYLAVLYLLTGLHALHVLGGLGYSLRLALRARPAPASLRVSALYWHFMGLIWAVVLALLLFGR